MTGGGGLTKLSLRAKLVGILSLATLLTLAILFSFYYKMLIDWPAFAWLAAVTAAAGILSAAVVYSATRPVVRDIETLADAARRVAGGDFDVRVRVRSQPELRALAAAFNTMASEVQSLFEQQKQSEAARRRLVANVTHDLRTPLTATAAMVQALQDGVADEPDIEARYLKTVSREIDYMIRLLRDLTDLMQLESGQIRIQRSPTNLEDLLAEVLETFGVAIQQKSAAFSVSIPSGLSPIEVDATRLRQALTNVVQNAVSYAPEGSVVQVRVAQEEGAIRLTVRDEGPGIPPEVGERVFERFYRGDPARGRGKGLESGMGLGLAIARDIVRLHGGEIGIASGPSKGTEVWLTLPDSARSHPIRDGIPGRESL